ncbi:MAG: hypothetical protein WDZ44_01980, partial [Candidatus Spechtbacterales bacterium]
MSKDIFAASTIALLAPILTVGAVWYASELVATPSAPTEAPVAAFVGVDEVQQNSQGESQPEEVAEEIGEQQPEGPIVVARDFDIESYESEA